MLSALPKEGKTVLTANLGQYLSVKLNQKVLIIDADFRVPSMHKVFNISGDIGLANVLEGKDSIENAIVKVAPNLSVLPGGSTLLNPVILLYSPGMAKIMKEIKEKYEIVLVDCAYLKDFKDGVVLSSYTEGIVLVIDESKSRRYVIKNAMISLEDKKNNMIGIILNNRKFVIPKIIYERM
jgi:capsular exopolysaccharide synthesis family protein